MHRFVDALNRSMNCLTVNAHRVDKVAFQFNELGRVNGSTDTNQPTIVPLGRMLVLLMFSV